MASQRTSLGIDGSFLVHGAICIGVDPLFPMHSDWNIPLEWRMVGLGGFLGGEGVGVGVLVHDVTWRIAWDRHVGNWGKRPVRVRFS